MDYLTRSEVAPQLQPVVGVMAIDEESEIFTPMQVFQVVEPKNENPSATVEAKKLRNREKRKAKQARNKAALEKLKQLESAQAPAAPVVAATEGKFTEEVGGDIKTMLERDTTPLKPVDAEQEGKNRWAQKSGKKGAKRRNRMDYDTPEQVEKRMADMDMPVTDDWQTNQSIIDDILYSQMRSAEQKANAGMDTLGLDSIQYARRSGNLTNKEKLDMIEQYSRQGVTVRGAKMSRHFESFKKKDSAERQHILRAHIKKALVPVKASADGSDREKEAISKNADIEPLVKKLRLGTGVILDSGTKVCSFTLVRSDHTICALTVWHPFKEHSMLTLKIKDKEGKDHVLSVTPENVFWPPVDKRDELDICLVEVTEKWSQLGVAVPAKHFCNALRVPHLLSGAAIVGALIKSDLAIVPTQIQLVAEKGFVPYYKHVASTVKGDCGSLLVTSDTYVCGPTRQPVVIGIHGWGSKSEHQNGAYPFGADFIGYLN